MNTQDQPHLNTFELTRQMIERVGQEATRRRDARNLTLAIEANRRARAQRWSDAAKEANV